MNPPKPTGRSAMTLIELLVVIAIIGILSSLAISSISGLQRGTAMTTTASQVMDYLATGRQIAMTLNQPVKVWFCTGATNDSLLLYRTDTGKAAGPELKINERIVMSTNDQWSSVLTDSASGPQQPDPKRGASCYSFRFFPDGSTDLAGTNSPTLTLVYRTDAASTSLPPNFFTLQIDQQTGALRTFRRQ